MNAEQITGNEALAGEHGMDVTKVTLAEGASWSNYRDHINQHVDAFLARRRDVAMSSSAAGNLFSV